MSIRIYYVRGMGGSVGLAYMQALKREPVSKLLSSESLVLGVMNRILKSVLATLLGSRFQARPIITFRIGIVGIEGIDG